MIPGNHRSLLDDKHASGCDGNEYSTCESVPNMVKSVDPDPDRPDFWVLYITWCGECGAAGFEVVGSG